MRGMFIEPYFTLIFLKWCFPMKLVIVKLLASVLVVIYSLSKVKAMQLLYIQVICICLNMNKKVRNQLVWSYPIKFIFQYEYL